jgi:hypothetical protein
VTVLEALRFAKLLAVLALASGTIGAFVPRDLEDRQRAAYWLAGPGFLVSWLFGVLVAWQVGTSLLEPWILATLATSVLSIHVVLWSTGTEGRRTPLAATLAVLSLLASLALMVWRPR